MKYLIKDTKIIHPDSTFSNKRVDILVENGKIKQIGKNVADEKAKIIKGRSLFTSVGWLDIGTHLGEPGYEQRETISSLSAAALAGGFTDIATFPQATPPIQSAPQVKALIDKGKESGITIHPIGALSENLRGENITEYIDMHHAGAVAFSDGLTSIQSGGLLLRALQYTKHFDGLIISNPYDKSLSNGNHIHEGNQSIKLGISGSPTIAEELAVIRDIKLNEYAESKICLHSISTKEAIKAIKSAKKKGQRVVTGVSYLNLVKAVNDLIDFDTNTKVKPPIRDKQAQNALLKAVKNGTIDYISTNHVPLEKEHKDLEYYYASHGAIGLQTAFAALHTILSSQMSIELTVSLLAYGPRKVLNLEIPEIDINNQAILTTVDSKAKWVFDKKSNLSLSENSPFFDQSFEGKVICTMNGKTTNISD